jgi:hypothetical protein
MRKEFLTVEFPSAERRNSFSRHLKECIEFSSSRKSSFDGFRSFRFLNGFL